MGTEATRLRKQTWFVLKFREAKKQEKYLSKDKVITDFCFEMIASQRQAKEFLDLFEKARIIKLHKDRIEVLK